MLRLAGGDGYVRLLCEDLDRHALLLERLGAPLYDVVADPYEMTNHAGDLTGSWAATQSQGADLVQQLMAAPAVNVSGAGTRCALVAAYPDWPAAAPGSAAPAKARPLP